MLDLLEKLSNVLKIQHSPTLDWSKAKSNAIAIPIVVQKERAVRRK